MMPCIASYNLDASSAMVRAARSAEGSSVATRCAIDNAMLRMAVTDCPNSSCNSRAMLRRSSSIC